MNTSEVAGPYLLNVDAVTGTAKDEASLHCLGKPFGLRELVRLGWSQNHWDTHLIGNLFLLLDRKIDEMVVFGTNQEGNSRLVETSSLAIPFFDRIKRALPSQVEHEEDSYSIVADERKHVDEFALATQIPDGESDFCVSD
jgi:hypothetical protein